MSWKEMLKQESDMDFYARLIREKDYWFNKKYAEELRKEEILVNKWKGNPKYAEKYNKTLERVKQMQPQAQILVSNSSAQAECVDTYAEDIINHILPRGLPERMAKIEWLSIKMKLYDLGDGQIFTVELLEEWFD